MKIFLSTPPGKTEERWPPLGLLSLSACIRRERPGDEVVVMDAFCRNMDAESLLAAAVGEEPDLLGLNCSTHTFKETIEFMRAAAEALPESKLILGGYHATFTAERILRSYPFIDFIIKGEAERGLPQLLDCLESGIEPDEVEGISYLRGEELVDRPLAIIEDLDSLPPLDRSELGDVDYGYVHQGIALTSGLFTTLLSSRGCPYGCRYCSCAAFSLRRWRSRSPESVVDELESLWGQGYKSAVFVDDNFTQRRSFALKVCELIIERGVDMDLYCEGRVNNADLELLSRMKEAGFDVIFFGAESASPHVLEYYDKRITPEEVTEAVRNAKEAGMMVITSFIMGAPGESEEDLQRTVDFIRSLRPHAVEINILDYLAGTEIWQELEDAGHLAPGDWEGNLRAYEIPGGMSRELLQRYVDKGYKTYLDSWKCRDGYRELLSLIRHNRSFRRIVSRNLLRRQTWRILRGDKKVN